MSSLDFDLDSKMNHLEVEWRQAYESNSIARVDYRVLAASSKASASLLDMARQRVERSEALKVRIMAEMERLEDNILGQD